MTVVTRDAKQEAKEQAKIAAAQRRAKKIKNSDKDREQAFTRILNLEEDEDGVVSYVIFCSTWFNWNDYVLIIIQ